MAIKKNALTEYFIGKDGTADTPLARYIEEVTQTNDESVEERGYYDGDGNPEQEVESVSLGFEFSGIYDEADPAQKLIAELQDKTGEDRKITLRVETPGGTTREGEATVTDIVAGGGPATEFPEFSCTITWNGMPTRSGVSVD